MDKLLEQIKSITSQKESILSPFINPLKDTFEKYSINTPTRQAHFITQVAHESGSFRYTEEIASGTAYENRADLGNIISGDGIRFKGKGLIQITGRNNYKKLSGTFGVDFVSNPYLLKTPEWACKSAGWFWDSKKLNGHADKNNFLTITYLINGGQNGLQERLKFLVKSFKVFGVNDIQKIIDSTLLIIENNIAATKNSHFQKMLFKAVPTRQIFNQLKDSIRFS